MTGPREGGFVTAEWAVAVAVLLVPVLLLAGLLPTWAADRDAAVAAAREAARTAAVQPVAGAAAATAAAAAVLAHRGIDPDRGAVAITGPASGAGGSPRTGTWSVTVTLNGRAVPVPLLGVVDGPAVTGTHVVALDPYRSRP